MNVQKLSISLPEQQFLFIKDYQIKHHYRSRSDVIQAALRLLQHEQLKAHYREANEEINSDFENTTLDGLDIDETW